MIVDYTHALKEARNKALEDAARLCEGAYPTGSIASTLKEIGRAHV